MKSLTIRPYQNKHEKNTSQLMWVLLALLIFVFGFLLWSFYNESLQDIDRQTQAMLQFQVVGLDQLLNR